MNKFANYSDIIWDAFDLHHKKTETIERKKEILDKVFEYYNLNPKTFLFVGFNPLIFAVPKNSQIYLTEVSSPLFEKLSKQISVKNFEYSEKTFDCVIAVDEFLTFAENEAEQLAKISKLCSYTKDLLLTTVKDYKNQDFKEREYSHPAIIKTGTDLTAFFETHNWDLQEKNSWDTAVYQTNNSNATCRGLYRRRCLYFKQLAKFCHDAGSTDFLVHKNLMYKSLIKKNYEHVISVKFDK